MSDKDGIVNTFVVAIGVCLVCSFLVSFAAIALKPLQEKNRELDIKSNIVRVAGFDDDAIKSAGGVEKIYESRFQQTIIDMNTGDEAIDRVQELFGFASAEEALDKYDQFKASKVNDAAKSTSLGKDDPARIKKRETFSNVYVLLDEDGNPSKYILPIRGLGLWSMLKGFISLEPDFQTIAGITYYEHGETPGLGGEVDNVKWKASWTGKKVFGDSGEIKIEVVKGVAGDEFSVDGLSGATITSNGVTDMLKFWLGENGFGPYIEKQKSMNSSTNTNSNSEGASDG